jgi:alkylation response protein AidB-like acyl-CoA dehydrogenase
VTRPGGLFPATWAPLQRAQRLADDLVRPQAEQVDRTVVPRTTLDAWGAAGLLGLTGPRSAGGGGAPPRVEREVQEVLAAACGATWFVATQHATPLAMLAASDGEDLQARLLAPMCSGEVLAGVAFTHLRRPGSAPVTAVRQPGGWRFDGVVGWLTGWGICDVVLLAGESPDGEAVFVLVPAREAAGMTASAPLELAAMQATRTVSLGLDGFVVPDADVVRVVDLAAWRADDAARAADAKPHVFGLQRECVRRLSETAAARGDGAAAALAQQLSAEGERLRRVAYALADELPRGEALEDRMAVRAASLELVVRSATSLVVATGGAGMRLDAAPQRLAREAVFYLVQAQTPAVREATLQLLRDSGA